MGTFESGPGRDKYPSIMLSFCNGGPSPGRVVGG